VNPSAAANVSSWKPDPSAAQAQPEKPADLQRRPPKQ
jgi:hypothetical protein